MNFAGYKMGIRTLHELNYHVPRVKASHQLTVDFGCGQQPGEGWEPPGYFALGTLHDEDNQKHHTVSAVA